MTLYLVRTSRSSRLLQDASMNYELRHEQIFLFNSALVWRCALFIFHVCMKLDTQMLNINKITIKSLIHSAYVLSLH